MITNILKGIDMREVDHTDGWWETETGALFGRVKLIEAQGYECVLLQRIAELESGTPLRVAHAANNEQRMIIVELEAWKTAVIDALAVTCSDAPIGTAPRDIINQVVDFYVCFAKYETTAQLAHLQPITAVDVTDEMWSTFSEIAAQSPPDIMGEDKQWIAAAYNAVIKYRGDAKWKH